MGQAGGQACRQASALPHNTARLTHSLGESRVKGLLRRPKEHCRVEEEGSLVQGVARAIGGEVLISWQT